jgi:hypothetical protein
MLSRQLPLPSIDRRIPLPGTASLNAPLVSWLLWSVLTISG